MVEAKKETELEKICPEHAQEIETSQKGDIQYYKSNLKTGLTKTIHLHTARKQTDLNIIWGLSPEKQWFYMLGMSKCSPENDLTKVVDFQEKFWIIVQNYDTLTENPPAWVSQSIKDSLVKQKIVISASQK